MSGFHAPLAFSAADRWVECPGSVQLSEGLPPEPDDEPAMEGNAADWVVKEYVAGREHPYGTPIPLPGGYTVDHDMIYGAKLWLETIGYGATSGVPVISADIHPTDAWGEPDGWTWDPITRRLRVPDYKHGFGIHEVHGHWQTIGYAWSLLEMLDLLNDPDVEVWITIVQPRAWHPDGPVRTWKTTSGALVAWVNQMRSAARDALPPEGSSHVRPNGPPTKTGPHCLYCPAARHSKCKTLQAATSHVAQFAGNAQRIDLPADSLGTQLAIIRHARELLEAAETGLTAQVDALLRGGQRVHGWRMERKEGKLAWNEGVTVDHVRLLGMEYNVQADKPPSLSQTVCTPTQLKNAGVPEIEVKKLASRGIGWKLVEDDGSAARRAFGDVSC